jgi:hypothetical protein
VAIYDGVVSLGEDDVHVILGVEDDRVTLSSNGAEVGSWESDEISIRYRGGGTYTITAEDETLEFVPNDQDLFAIRFGEVSDDPPTPSANGSGKHARARIADPEADAGGPAGSEEAPPPRPITKIAFYVLVALTALLGLWAVVSMIMS